MRAWLPAALLIPLAASAQIGPPPPPVAVSTITNLANGHTQTTMTDGSVQDRGIANRPGNVAYTVTSAGSSITVPAGVQYVILTGSGTIAAQSVQLPTSPQDGDQIYISTTPGLTITSMQALGVTGTSVGTATMRPMTGMPLLYRSAVNDWVPRLMPATLYGDAQAVAAGQAAGFVTAAQVPGYTLPAATSGSLGGVKAGANTTVATDGTLSVAAPYTDAQALAAAKAGLGSAAQQPATAFYPAGSNPAGYLTVAPVTSVASLTGAPTVAQMQAALSLGSAAYQPSSAFLTPSAAAATYYPLSSNPAGYLASCPAASATTPGCVIRGKAAVSGTIAAVSLLNAGLLAPITVAVSGVQLGDNVNVVLANAPSPAGLYVAGWNVTAANTVQIIPASYQALSLMTAQATSFNVYWSR